MKLLDWVHRKFRQNNSSETHKDCSIGCTGQPSLEDLQYYPRGSYFSKPFSKSQKDNYTRNSFTSLVEEEDGFEEEREAALTELFHGFLAIGTLGNNNEPNSACPGTPTFSVPADNYIAAKETEINENQLKLINDELEKVLGVDENCNVSSARTSHVSTGRISHCSTITLSGNPIEGDEVINGNGAIICPLQSYLLASATKQAEAALPLRKERRHSLGELFQKTKEENGGTKSEKKTDKETDKSAIHLMKKMLKKKVMQASSKSSSTDSAKDEKKLHKIRHMFNRKVHPENSAYNHQTNYKPTKHEVKNNNMHVAASYDGSIRSSSDDIIIYPQGRDSTESYKNQSHFHQRAKSSVDTSGNEFWVKTDSEYLVLEL